MGIGYIAKVLMKGQHLCCKIATEHTCNSVQREYECLHAIAVDRNNSHIRVPKFIGFVVDDDGNTVGILEEFVDHDVHLGKALVDSSGVSDMRRKNWAEQIRETLNLLHKIGVVWGDGKPENILIHSKTDDAWLVDFGGSYTDGWVDAKLKETVAGDEQALQKIIKLLAV
jgi:serine/threonine protein kinase